jgi:hypothetical protein
MTSLQNLHSTLQTLSILLDQGAGQIHDRSKPPTHAQIESVSQLLVAICSIQTAIYKENLEPQASRLPDDTSVAIRRLGDLIIMAEALMAAGHTEASIKTLDDFMATETCEFHREIAQVTKRKLLNQVALFSVPD